MDNSRASSVENEVSSLNLTDKKSFSEDEDADSNDPADMIRPKIRRGAGRKARTTVPKKMVVKISKQNSLEEGDLPDSNSSTPPLDASRPVRAAVANANAISGNFLKERIFEFFITLFPVSIRSTKRNEE